MVNGSKGLGEHVIRVPVYTRRLPPARSVLHKLIEQLNIGFGLAKPRHQTLCKVRLLGRTRMSHTNTVRISFTLSFTFIITQQKAWCGGETEHRQQKKNKKKTIYDHTIHTFQMPCHRRRSLNLNSQPSLDNLANPTAGGTCIDIL